MKNNSTRIMLAFITFLLMASFNINGQSINNISITSPESIAANYSIVPAGFGLMTAEEITGQAIFGMDGVDTEFDGCSEITNDVAGKICFIDRGNCEFGTKVWNAEKAGAIAVVVCNIYEGSLAAEMGPGDDGNNVTVFAGMITKEDCDIIRAELQNNNIEISINEVIAECFLSNELPIVWGVNEEGSFSGNMEGWEAYGPGDDDEKFQLVADPTNQGVIRNGAYTLQSPTACTGAIIADFDYFTTEGDGDILDQLTPPYPAYSGHITSPTINLSNVAFPLVSFHQFYLRLNGSAYFQFSIDNGLTWSPEELIETKNILTATNESDDIISEEKFIAIPLAANQPEVKLRFSYVNQDFYFWMLDDIVIVGEFTTSVQEDLDEALINVYPNPSKGIINVELDKAMDSDFSIQLHSMNGKLIHSQAYNQATSSIRLNLENHIPGLYVLSVSSDNQEYNKKIYLE